MPGFHQDTQEDILPLFSELREDLGNYACAARPLIKGREAGPLLAAMAAQLFSGCRFRLQHVF